MPPTMPLLSEADNSSPPSDRTLIFTNLKLLDCRICCLPLKAPIFQGHLACFSCCNSIKNVCPSCSFPIYIRCLFMEKFLESLYSFCPNIEYGCKERISYGKIQEHELMCIHAPCSCPHRGCDFLASAKVLKTHYLSEHSEPSSELESKGKSSIHKQPYSRPKRSRKTPKWLQDFKK